jgi:hypothetical protein
MKAPDSFKLSDLAKMCFIGQLSMLSILLVTGAGCGESRSERWKRWAGDAVPLTSPRLLEGTFFNQATDLRAVLLWNCLGGGHSHSTPEDVVRLALSDRELNAELFHHGTSRGSLTLRVTIKGNRAEAPRRWKAAFPLIVIYGIGSGEVDLGVDGKGRLLVVVSGGGVIMAGVLPLDANSSEFCARFERVGPALPAGGQ